MATLSTDDPPIITAIAAGNVTITGGNASADLTVFPGPTLPLGTTIWSNPGDGSGVISIVPAVPSSTGVADVFAMQGDGNVQAIKTDGTVAWTQNVGTNSRLLPDFQGGLTFATNSSVSRLDGMTGAPSLLYTFAQPPNYSTPVVHTDGTIFTVDGDSVAVVNPLKGTQILIPITHSTYKETNSGAGCPNSSTDGLPKTYNLIIAGDGYAYLVYQYSVSVAAIAPIYGNCNYYTNSTTHNEVHERLLRVGTDGSSIEIPVGDWTSDATHTYIPNGDTDDYETIDTQAGQIPNRVEPVLITNADKGVLLSLNLDIPDYYAYLDIVYQAIVCQNPQAYCAGGSNGTIVSQNLVSINYSVKLLTVTAGSVTSNQTLPSQIIYLEPDLQAQDGTFFGIVDYDWDAGDDFLGSFDKSGNIKWSNLGYYAQIATSDGGVIGQSYAGQSYTFDANGNSTGQLSQPATVSWTGNAYADGPVTQLASGTQLIDASSFWSRTEANPSASSTASQRFQVKINTFKLNNTSTIDFSGAIKSAQDTWSKQSNGTITLLWDKIVDGNISPCATPGCRPSDAGDLLYLNSTDLDSQWQKSQYYFQKFPNRTGINVVEIYYLHNDKEQAATLGTPLTTQGTFGAYGNILVVRGDTPNAPSGNILAHEIGHVFGLYHVANPFNLMCGTPPGSGGFVDFFTEFMCASWLGFELNDDQIKTAKAGAAQLVEK